VSNDLLLMLPLIIPMSGAILGIVALRLVRLQAAIAVLMTVALLVAAILLLIRVWNEGPIATQPGNWPAPFGITIVADTFSATMVVLGAIVAFCAVLFASANTDEYRTRFGFFPLVSALVLGVMGAFLTGDLFNLYVWFEVMLISSFVLLGLGGERQQMEGAIKYVTLNLVSSTMFLAGLGLLYGVAGTLNMADLAVQLRDVEADGLILTIATLFLISFGLKAAVFPFFWWLPASYHTPPIAVSALFAGLLTKVGVYSLIRVFSMIFTQDVNFIQDLLFWIAGFTMVTGVLGAAAQDDMRRILSFHIISQIGYMVMGLAFFTPLGYAAALFFIAHNMFAKTGLFLVAGITHHLYGSYELKHLGGIMKRTPELALVAFVCAFSLAGVPPLAGFFGKLALVRAGFEAEHYIIASVSLAVGLLTMFSMTKIWAEGFWKKAPSEPPALFEEKRRSPLTRYMLVPAFIFATLSAGIGVGAGPAFELVSRAGDELAAPSAYLTAVLGEEYLEEHGQ
jgi:multicomponent Na+:H+ antiporter subunit D